MAALLCAVAVLLVGGCGTQVAGPPGAVSGTASVTPPTTVAGPIAWVTVEPSAVTGARLSADRRTLTLETRVPSGRNACMRGLKAVLTDPVPGSVRVQITFSSPSLDQRSGCTGEKPATARVRLAAPLGTQDVVVDEYVVFSAEGADLPALRLCGKLGCRPPATGCTPDSYDQALMAVDAPEHTYRAAQNCDGTWLVLDFSWGTGPACGDETDSACTSSLGDRWFFRAAPAGWVPIVESAAGGCGDVHRREPAFPTALCASLAPLSSALHPHYPPPSTGAKKH